MKGVPGLDRHFLEAGFLGGGCRVPLLGWNKGKKEPHLEMANCSLA